MRKTLLPLCFIIVGCGSSSSGSPAPQTSDDAGPDVSQGACTCPDDANPCTFDECKNGKCEHSPVEAVIACPGGKCHAGQCCKGCWDGIQCVEGAVSLACGSGGVKCEDCRDINECTTDTCDSDHKCKHTAASDTSCTNGVCMAGECKCGEKGQPCCAGSNCSGGLPCLNGTCGECGAPGQPCCDGTTCAAGGACVNKKCAHCGKADEPCCTNGGCDQGLSCTADTCKACGGPGQPCCGGGICATGNNCTPNGCVACGALGQPCCAQGQQCQGELNACGANVTCEACFPVMAAGRYGTCAIRRDGKTWCWGEVAPSISGCDFSACPLEVSLKPGVQIKQIGIGNGHSCILTSDGAISCAGSNSVGQLGIGTAANSATFVKVGDSYEKLFVGHRTSCGILAGGVAYCWGEAIGNPDAGSFRPQFTPKLMDFKVDSVEPLSLAFLMKSGTVRQFSLESVSLVDVASLSSVVGISPGKGNGSLAARKSDGTVWNWVYYLGEAPQHMTELDGALKVAGGELAAFGVMPDGTVRFFGGVLTGDSAFDSSATTLYGLANVVDIVAGPYHTCVRDSSGAIKCWGFRDLVNGAPGLGGPDPAASLTSPRKVVGLSCQ